MSSPFDILGEPKKPKLPDYELVGGAMSCQTQGCYDVSHEAKYFADAQLLTWKCSEGHINKIEDIKL